jgi:hypothetical protein
MSYTYLFELYEMIEQRLAPLEKSISELPHNSNQDDFLKGRMDVLLDLKNYLEKQLNPKLPRAIQKKLKQKSS